MAIEYTLYLETDGPPARLHEVLCTCTGSDPGVAATDPLYFSGEALQGVVSALDDTSRQFINQDFSFDARARVSFRLDKFDLERAQDVLIRCISEVAGADASDMMLLFNGELVVLRRRGGDLMVREEFGVWTPERLSLLGAAYRIVSVV